jgi:hypothetical protein
VSGIFLAFSVRELVALATRNDCTIDLIPQVGDFYRPMTRWSAFAHRPRKQAKD